MRQTIYVLKSYIVQCHFLFLPNLLSFLQPIATRMQDSYIMNVYIISLRWFLNVTIVVDLLNSSPK